jgi:hypothetical protein
MENKFLIPCPKSEQTNSKEQNSSWEANSRSTSQEISLLLCNPNIHYRVHKSPPLVPILSQMNPIHILPPYFSKILTYAYI